MRSLRTLVGVLAGFGLGAAVCAAAEQPAPPANPQAVEFFEAKVRPVLVENCFKCHGEKKQQGGLRLDTRDSALRGGDSGKVILPGEPDKSLLVQAIRYGGELKMPPKSKLPPHAVDALTAWVKMGAPWPEEAGASTVKNALAEDAAKKHWAFQPVRKPPLPPLKDSARASTPVDHFILFRLEEKGLALAPQADRRTLLRRVTFDLTGLPPSPEEIDAFINDHSDEAFAGVVDRLLASPRYGERWGRYWLDIARYADTKGYVFTEERRFPYAYTYRDYVIRALNDDLPYDQFILQQLAADRLQLGDDKRPLAAMGFLTLGRRFLNNQHDIIDDRIDVVTRGLLGLTVTCARCHDHKYDPIPQKDYYSLYGVFASSVEPKDPPVLAMPERTEAFVAYEKELKTREEAVRRFSVSRAAALTLAANASGPIRLPTATVRRFFGRTDRDKQTALQRRVDQFRSTAPAAPPRPMMLEDTASPVNPHVFLRGNPNNPGPTVPRQFLSVLAGEKRRPFQQGSGRLELAQAIASKDNPLTARVLVNRVWMHHFGTGLVRSPSNFGLRSDPPVYPELLDFLAARFVEEGWSIKKLHRLILLSSVYQQTSDDNPTARVKDPENLLFWRMNRQRIDLEALRDGLLAAAGQLDLTMAGPPVDLTTQPFNHRRTIYGFIDRQNLPGLFRSFDFASPDAHSPQRYATTVPQQALFLMNSPFLAEQAHRLVGRSDIAAPPAPAERIQKLYRLLYGREATPEEVSLGMRFLEAARAEETARSGQSLTAWEKYGQILLLANEFAFID